MFPAARPLCPRYVQSRRPVLSCLAMQREMSPEAKALLIDAYRRIGPAGRLKIAFALTDFAHGLYVARILLRHPEYNEADAQRKLAESLCGMTLA
jgi:hypothetical protein